MSTDYRAIEFLRNLANPYAKLSVLGDEEFDVPRIDLNRKGADPETKKETNE